MPVYFDRDTSRRRICQAVSSPTPDCYRVFVIPLHVEGKRRQRTSSLFGAQRRGCGATITKNSRIGECKAVLSAQRSPLTNHAQLGSAKAWLSRGPCKCSSGSRWQLFLSFSVSKEIALQAYSRIAYMYFYASYKMHENCPVRNF